jgi:hypothetical protein
VSHQCLAISLFFMVEWYSMVYIYHIFFIHSLVLGHLGWFHSLAAVNSAVCKHGCAGTSYCCFCWCISLVY